ncbi:MAG: hypothetical protein IJE43_12205 [Alphaproteobacteria bacterium]|nr:hypothetical protein [Alphaproteobacteria bacterium]
MSKTKNKQIVSKLIKNDKKEPVDLVIKLNTEPAEEIHINVFPQLDFEDRLAMTKDIYKFVCISDEGENLDPMVESYQPELRTYAQRFSVITYFTDLELPSETDAEMKMVNQLVMNTSLYEKIMEIVGNEAESVFQEADELIKAYRDTAIANKNFNSIANKLTSFIDGITDQFKNINLDEIKNLLGKFQNADIEDIISKIHTENTTK